MSAYYGMNLPKIPVVIESVFDKENRVLIDFPANSSNFGREQEFKSSFIFDEFKGFTQPTNKFGNVIEFKNVQIESLRSPQEGSFYYLPYSWLMSNIEPVFNEEQPYLGYSCDAPLSTADFESSIRDGQKSMVFRPSPFALDNLEAEQPKLEERVKVVVLDVGQGNFNAIKLNNDHAVLFDLGGEKLSSFDSAYERLMNEHGFDTCREIEIVLSHWDWDHIVGIKSRVLEWNKVKRIFYTNQIPSQTKQEALDNLDRNILRPIEPLRRRTGIRRPTKRLDSFHVVGPINMFRGTKSRYNNTNGLSITLDYDDGHVIFPADMHYVQVRDFLQSSDHNYHQTLVTPHHAGRAGDHRMISTIRNLQTMCTSVGGNGRYGHPIQEVVDEALRNTQNYISTHTDSDFVFFCNV